MNRILIVKPSSLGDVVHALRVVRQIKVKFPKCEIHWVIKDGLEGILESVQWIDRYFIFQRGGGTKAYIRLISKIRKFEYDFCLDLQGLLRSALIGKLSISRKKLGRADGRELSTFFYRSIGDSSRKKEIHAIDRLTPFLSYLGVVEYNKKLPLDFLWDIDSSKISEVPKNFILLFPESRRQEKVWPYFQDLASWITTTYGQIAVVAGTGTSNEYQNCLDLRGQIKLKELPTLINKASLVVCNDSAPLHLSSALGVKLIALFGPTSTQRYGPYPSDQNQNFILNSDSSLIKDIELKSVQDCVESALG